MRTSHSILRNEQNVGEDHGLTFTELTNETQEVNVTAGMSFTASSQRTHHVDECHSPVRESDLESSKESTLCGRLKMLFPCMNGATLRENFEPDPYVNHPVRRLLDRWFPTEVSHDTNHLLSNSEGANHPVEFSYSNEIEPINEFMETTESYAVVPYRPILINNIPLSDIFPHLSATYHGEKNITLSNVYQRIANKQCSNYGIAKFEFNDSVSEEIKTAVSLVVKALGTIFPPGADKIIFKQAPSSDKNWGLTTINHETSTAHIAITTRTNATYEERLGRYAKTIAHELFLHAQADLEAHYKDVSPTTAFQDHRHSYSPINLDNRYLQAMRRVFDQLPMAARYSFSDAVQTEILFFAKLDSQVSSEEMLLIETWANERRASMEDAIENRAQHSWYQGDSMANLSSQLIQLAQKIEPYKNDPKDQLQYVPLCNGARQQCEWAIHSLLASSPSAKISQKAAEISNLLTDPSRCSNDLRYLKELSEAFIQLSRLMLSS